MPSLQPCAHSGVVPEGVQPLTGPRTRKLIARFRVDDWSIRMANEQNRPLRAILVDDYPPLLTALTSLLRRRGDIEIVGHAYNGREGLKLAEEQQPDLVLVDFSMPDIDGVVVTRRLKASPRPPKVVVMSFHAEPEYREMAMHAGADAYLVKTDLYQDLIPLLERIAV